MDTVELTEWIDPEGIEAARRHLDCIQFLDRTPHAGKRIAFLHSYLNAVDRVYGPSVNFGVHKARSLFCTYTRQRSGRLYCCTHRGPQKYDEDFPRYICAQGMPSILRHYLMRKWARDLDIANCHVSLMYQLGSKLHEWEEHKGRMLPLSLHMMKDLFEDRASFIEEVADAHGVDRDEAKWPGYRKDMIKTLLLRIMYGGSYDSWMEENGIYGLKSRRILRLQSEIEHLRTAILCSERFGHLIRDETRAQRMRQNVSTRVERSVFSKIAQHLECTVLLSMFEYLVKNGWTVYSLVFDGLMVEASKGKPSLLAMQEYVKENTGFTVSIVEKPLYDPSAEIDFDSLHRWVTGREPSPDDHEKLLNEFMSGAEGDSANGGPLKMRGFSALAQKNQN